MLKRKSKAQPCRPARSPDLSFMYEGVNSGINAKTESFSYNCCDFHTIFVEYETYNKIEMYRRQKKI